MKLISATSTPPVASPALTWKASSPEEPISAQADAYSPSESFEQAPNQAQMLAASRGSVGGEFLRGVGDQVKDAWHMVTHPRESYQALRDGVQRVIQDPQQAGKDALRQGQELAQQVSNGTAEENSRRLGQNLPIPGLRQMAGVGALVRISKAIPGSGAVQSQLEKLEKSKPSAPPAPGEVNLGNSQAGPRPHAQGSEGARKEAEQAQRDAAGNLAVKPDSQRIDHPTQQQKELMDKHKLDNPKALSTDFYSNGIHVKPQGQNVHIQYTFKDGQLKTKSADGASPGQLEAARLRLLTDPEFRKQMSEQIQSGLTNNPPRDPAARAHAEQFLNYLRSLDQKQ